MRQKQMICKCHVEGCNGVYVETVGDDKTTLGNGEVIVTPNIATDVCNVCGDWSIWAVEHRKIEKQILAKYPNYYDKPCKPDPNRYLTYKV